MDKQFELSHSRIIADNEACLRRIEASRQRVCRLQTSVELKIDVFLDEILRLKKHK